MAVRNRIPILYSANFSKMRISMDTLVMFQSVKGRKPRVVRNTLLMLPRVDVVRQGLSGIRHRCHIV
jgi:hypothetical protein